MDFNKQLEAETEWRLKNYQLENELIRERIITTKLDQKLMAANAKLAEEAHAKYLAILQEDRQERSNLYKAEAEHWLRIERVVAVKTDTSDDAVY